MCVCVADMPGVVAEPGDREPVLRAGQPVAVLRAAAAGDRGVLHVHLEEGEPQEGAGRADAQRSEPGAAVQDEGDHDDHVRGGAVRALVAAAVRRVLRHQVLAAAARRRAVHDRVAADRAVAGRGQLVHQPAAVRHLQPPVPRGLQGAAVRQDMPGVRLQQLGQVLQQPGGHRAQAQQQPQEARHAQDHRRHIRARGRRQRQAAGGGGGGGVRQRRPGGLGRGWRRRRGLSRDRGDRLQVEIVVPEGRAPRQRGVCRLRGTVLLQDVRQLVRVMPRAVLIIYYRNRHHRLCTTTTTTTTFTVKTGILVVI